VREVELKAVCWTECSVERGQHSNELHRPGRGFEADFEARQKLRK